MKRLFCFFFKRFFCIFISIFFAGIALNTVAATKIDKRLYSQNGWIDDIKIKALPALNNIGLQGYFEQRFMIANKANKQKIVKLKIVCSDNNEFHNPSEFSKTIVVPANSMVNTAVYVNSPFLYYHKLDIEIDGDFYQGNEDFGIHIVLTKEWEPLFLLSNRVDGDLSKFPFSENRRRGNRHTSTKITFDVDSLSENFLAYTTFNALIFTQKEYEEFPSKVKSAIEKYVELGGNLVIEEAKIPTKTDGKLGQCKFKVLLYGKIFYCPVKFKKLEKGVDDLLISTLRSTTTARTGKKSFPIILKNPINNTVLVSIIVVFALIAGPVSFIYLAIKKRKILIIWITPVVAVIFSSMIIIYSVTAEGLHARIRAVSYTFLDENKQLATTLGVHGYYCPIVPKSLQYDNNCEIISTNHSYFHFKNNAHSIDWTGEQLLTDNWIKPRIESYLRIRKSEKRLEKLSIVSQDREKLVVINGLGTALKELAVRTKDGSYYKSDSVIKAGEKATLKKAKKLKKYVNFIPYTSVMQINTGTEKFRSKITVCYKFLRDGSYFAVCEKSPFLKHGITENIFSIDLNEESFVYGILKNDGGRK
ncbi:hypothetical protein AAEX28_03000 [Lentisphaerota bacterium WC36G]|nr:hypothetical protein LJT99_05880 [Lentisphaerae bacterium WC36]